MTDAVSTIYDITQDSILRQEIRARDERIAVENRLKNEAAEAKKQLAKSEQRIAELEEALRKAQEK